VERNLQLNELICSIFAGKIVFFLIVMEWLTMFSVSLKPRKHLLKNKFLQPFGKGSCVLYVFLSGLHNLQKEARTMKIIHAFGGHR
jgi:hypothetical protein